MTRLELLQLVVARARSNGLDLRRWYVSRLGLPWISADAALVLLDTQRRYYALLFSHEFASTFWKPGSEISFEIPAGSFQRPMPDGTVRTVQRKSFIRRSARRDVWRYHLQHMALAEEPLRYLRKYMHIEEQLDPEMEAATKPSAKHKKRTHRNGAETPNPAQPLSSQTAGKEAPKVRPLPTESPAFLKRPYPGSVRTI